ncbi:LCP family protein [Actinomadura miaoliensis]|uniref:Cell envelope-related transcriptional attenuator domain-containing protein n=1 Tax=Actinomadura miaoliensis TaxID=430685 RepID=A0ABP7WLA6_9ACTN
MDGDAPWRGLGETLLVTAVSAVLPGMAHLRAGRVRTGTALLLSYTLALSGLVLAAGRLWSALVDAAVRPDRLAGLVLGCVALAGLWTLLIVHSYVVLRPGGLAWSLRFVGGAAVAVICALAALPPLTVAHYGTLQRDLLDRVFPGRDPAPAALPSTSPGAAPPPPTAPPAAEEPPVLPPRLDVLLIGADADVTRPGLRTDSMTVASIDTRTGRTLLLGLPRNLQRVPVWSGRGHVPFPPEELLNAVYALGNARPGVLAGGDGRRVRDPGAELLKRTVGHILGRPVPYYAMVDMRSFRELVDAMGGVRVCVGRPVPVPREQIPRGRLKRGCQRLSGREALWYGRSRTGSDDYDRMARQKCLMWAIARQARPLPVLRGFQRLSRTVTRSVSTDLPRGMLPELVRLAGRVRGAEVAGLQFVPPLIRTGDPDYRAIRRMTARAVAASQNGSANAADLHMLGKSCA